ncbi:MAG: VOC family protein [Chloroflexota bacterium]|nr:VOC family protein [Chloroflexota bacterium]
MSMVFSHIALNCADPIAVEKFYAKHFGFQRARVIPIGDGKQIVFIKFDTVYLEIFPADGARPVDAPAKDGYTFPGVRHLAFKVDNVDAKLAEMGDDAKIALGPFSFDDTIPGWRTVWVSDPEGNIIEISQGYVDEANPPALE